MIMIAKNNPFNIRYSGSNHWIGQIGQSRGFCEFQTLTHATRAICILILRSYRKKNVVTISEIIHRFAPPIENNTNKYVDFVCSRLSVFPFDIPCNLLEYCDLIRAIAFYETTTILNNDFILGVMKEYKITPYKFKKK